MLFDTTQPVLTMVLHSTEEFPNSHLLIDVFPNRIAPKAGYTHDDVILAIIGDAHCIHTGQWSRYSLDHWTSYGQNGHAFEHPLATLSPNAVQACTLLHPAAAPSGAQPVAMGDNTITIGSHAFARAAFSYPAYTPPSQDEARRTLRAHQYTSPCMLACALGMAEASASQPRLLEFVPPICARYALLCTDAADRTGKAARAHGREVGIDIKVALKKSWMVRPNRIGAITGLIASPDLDDVRAALRVPDAMEAGRAMGALFAEISTLDPYVLTGEDTPPTAHAAIQAKALGKQVDHALIRHTPVEALKPAARKAKERLAHA